MNRTTRVLPYEVSYQDMRERMAMLTVERSAVWDRAQRALTLALVCARDQRFEEAEIHADFARSAVAWLRSVQDGIL